MSVVQMIIISIGLSMDACAVSICNVLSLNRHGSWRKLIWMPILFGLFQSIMPLLGIIIGQVMLSFIGHFGHYLVAIVLGILALNMLYHALTDTPACQINRQLRFSMLIVQAIATALDALFVGLTFGAVGINPWNVIIIGSTTFTCVTIAILFAQKLGELLAGKANLVGSLLLFVIAISSLFQ